MPPAFHAYAGARFDLVVWALPATRAARRARALLRAELSGHIADEPTLADLETVVCELVTNATRHTTGGCELRLLKYQGVPVLCEVADCGTALDRVAEHLRRPSPVGDLELDALAVSGRGLGIVAVLTAGRCGVNTTTLCETGVPGKCVWFALPSAAVPMDPAPHDDDRLIPADM